jgi:diadenosine tetraphosphatase ApaH/serine/threonine PP2A family protein phosphatase
MAAIIGFLSDIHANLEALEACLSHAHAHGVERFVFLGDFVGYGADPRRVVEIIEQYVGRGALAIKGNHDEAVEKDATYMNASAKAAIDWARQGLSAPQKAFLAALPLCVHEGEMCFVHASADAPSRWNYIDSPSAALKSTAAADVAYTFSGHVHDQQLFFQNTEHKMSSFRPLPGTTIQIRRHRRWLALVGSVGQPRDGNPAAAYALFNRPKELLTFYRVPYDHFSAAAKIRRAGLPDLLAYRLESGA